MPKRALTKLMLRKKSSAFPRCYCRIRSWLTVTVDTELGFRSTIALKELSFPHPKTRNFLVRTKDI
jgi:hypothetical protein